MPRVIHSAGTSTRTREEFLELLGAYGIEVVIDVRRFPTSRLEHFKRENLQAFLEAHGIDYVYLGGELGGFRRGGYEAYTRTEDFSVGLAKLEYTASRRGALLLCAERLPWRCHRRFIARALKERGWRAVHIIEKGRHWEPEGAGQKGLSRALEDTDTARR